MFKKLLFCGVVICAYGLGRYTEEVKSQSLKSLNGYLKKNSEELLEKITKSNKELAEINENLYSQREKLSNLKKEYDKLEEKIDPEYERKLRKSYEDRITELLDDVDRLENRIVVKEQTIEELRSVGTVDATDVYIVVEDEDGDIVKVRLPNILEINAHFNKIIYLDDEDDEVELFLKQKSFEKLRKAYERYYGD